MTRIVAIGGGQAAASLVAKLRTEGFDGEITVIAEEPVPPYQRPPLSKAYLLGEMEEARLYLRPETYYAEQNITLMTSTRATGIDREAKVVHTSNGDVPYDHLVLTTGSVPRRLPAAIGGDLGGIYTVRTLADVDGMAHEFAEGKHALIVGGGYIGLEAAAVAAKRGMDVTLLEAADRILQRVAAPETSDYFRALHQSHGVHVLENTGLSKFVGDGHITGAVLADGREIEVDFAVCGIGIAPATALAEAAGLEIENGISTNALGQTSDPAIWSAGDCASFPFRGGRTRLESVQNAIDQAECVARNILGAGQDYVPHPWFWSDQFDVKLQIAGLNQGYDRTIVRPGDKDGVQSHWYYRGDKLLAVDAMNDPRAFMIGKRLIEAGKSPSAEVIAAPDTDLKALLKA